MKHCIYYETLHLKLFDTLSSTTHHKILKTNRTAVWRDYESHSYWMQLPQKDCLGTASLLDRVVQPKSHQRSQPSTCPKRICIVGKYLSALRTNSIIFIRFLLCLLVFWGSRKTSNWLRTSCDFDQQVATSAELDVLTADVLQFLYAEYNSGCLIFSHAM